MVLVQSLQAYSSGVGVLAREKLRRERERDREREGRKFAWFHAEGQERVSHVRSVAE